MTQNKTPQYIRSRIAEISLPLKPPCIASSVFPIDSVLTLKPHRLDFDGDVLDITAFYGASASRRVLQQDNNLAVPVPAFRHRALTIFKIPLGQVKIHVFIITNTEIALLAILIESHDEHANIIYIRLSF